MQQTAILVLGGIGGAVTTFLLQKYGVSVVVASCLVGLIGAVIGYFTKSSDLAAIIFAGSFVGMTSLAIGTVPLIIVAGAICGFIYSVSLSIFPGFGGRLGTTAFMSIVISTYVFSLIERILR